MRRRKFIVGAMTVVLLGLFLSGCGQEKEKELGADNASSPSESSPDVVASAPAKEVAAKAHPVTDETRRAYNWYCTQCHGISGKGNGINAPHTAVPPRDHTKGAYLETRSDEQLFHVIKFGGLAGGRAPCMPRWGHTFDDPTIHSLVNYIRELCECKAL